MRSRTQSFVRVATINIVVAATVLLVSGCGRSGGSSSSVPPPGTGGDAPHGRRESGPRGGLAGRLEDRAFRFEGGSMHAKGMHSTGIQELALCGFGRFSWQERSIITTSFGSDGETVQQHRGSWTIRGSSLILTIDDSTEVPMPGQQQFAVSVRGGRVCFNGQPAEEEGIGGPCAEARQASR